MAVDINDLGTFSSINAVWKAYPEGGHEGDYLTIGSVKYRWNKYLRIWENASTVTPTPARLVTTVGGDFTVNNDTIIGDELKVRGDTYLEGDVKVEGMLDAKAVKQPNRGFFQTEEALNAAYPKPEVGWWATVGDVMPGTVYRCQTEGVWTNTGQTGGVDTERVYFEIEDTCTSISTDKALSANQGKRLKMMIDSLKMAGYMFAGIATPKTIIPAPDEKVFYVGADGTYNNFGTPVTVNAGSICVFIYNGSWSSNMIKMFEGIDDEPTPESENLVKSGGAAKIGYFINDDNFLKAITDKENRLIVGIDKNGFIVFGKMPYQILNYLSNTVAYQEGKTLIDGGFAEKSSSSDNDLYLYAFVDKEGRVVAGIDKDGDITNKGKKVTNIIKDLVDKEKKEENNLSFNLDVLSKIFNTPVPHITDENEKEIYAELSVLNVHRRSEQYRFVEWDALSPIPKNRGVGGYYTNHQTGLPYASCMENDKFVGYDITLLTFMTAANNPYSMLYTENPRDNGSVYGFTYHTGRDTIAGWSGIVCNTMETYSTGMVIPWDTGMWSYLESVGTLVKVYDQSAQGVRIGDFLWESGHGRMVHSIWRDNNGLVNKIEAVTGGQSSPEYMFNTPEAFDADLAQRHGIIYRNTELFKNINYEQSPFITLEGETPIPFEYNNDICTYAGDYACFREGFKIVLNYNLKENKEWDTVDLYKDNVLYGSYSLSEDTGTYDRGPENYLEELAEELPAHSFDLSFLNLTHGKYKARLQGNGTFSDYTYFEVIDTDVSYSSDGDKVNVKYSSHNGKPLYARFSKINGGPKCLYELTEEDIKNGSCDIDVVSLIKKQYNNLSSDATYLKVYFKGDYGCVTNEPILITF